MWFIILATLSSAVCHPIDETETKTIIQLQKEIDLVSYIQNFKNAMANYVNSQYKSLTVNEMEEVKITLEEFLKDFAKDLKDTIDGSVGDEDGADDGLIDSTFDDIKTKIVEEFPDVNEDVAGKIVLKLRKNLYRTRNKLDEIIRNSQIAEIQNSED